MALTKIDIGNELGRGWALFKENMGLLVISGLVMLLVSAVSCGILSGPMTAGMYLIVRRLMQNDPVKPQAGDVFKGFDFFVQTLVLLVITIVACFVLALIPVIGQLAGLAVGTVMSWALLFVVYQKTTAIDALKKVLEYTKTGDFTLPLLFGVLVSIISGLGAIACFVGIFFTMPLGYCMMARCYETLFEEVGDAPIEPEVIPPPPQEENVVP